MSTLNESGPPEDLVALAHDPDCPRWGGDLAPDPLLAAIHRQFCDRCIRFAAAIALAQTQTAELVDRSMQRTTDQLQRGARRG